MHVVWFDLRFLKKKVKYRTRCTFEWVFYTLSPIGYRSLPVFCPPDVTQIS